MFLIYQFLSELEIHFRKVPVHVVYPFLSLLLSLVMVSPFSESITRFLFTIKHKKLPCNNFNTNRKYLNFQKTLLDQLQVSEVKIFCNANAKIEILC